MNCGSYEGRRRPSIEMDELSLSSLLGEIDMEIGEDAIAKENRDKRMSRGGDPALFASDRSLVSAQSAPPVSEGVIGRKYRPILRRSSKNVEIGDGTAVKKNGDKRMNRQGDTAALVASDRSLNSSSAASSISDVSARSAPSKGLEVELRSKHRPCHRRPSKNVGLMGIVRPSRYSRGGAGNREDARLHTNANAETMNNFPGARSTRRNSGWNPCCIKIKKFGNSREDNADRQTAPTDQSSGDTRMSHVDFSAKMEVYVFKK